MHGIHKKGDELFWDAIIKLTCKRKKHGKKQTKSSVIKRMENKNENYFRNLSYEFICLLPMAQYVFLFLVPIAYC